MNAPDRQPLDWRSAKVWQAVGYALTAAWMLFVIVRTDGDPAHPFFNTIFLVPIGGWIVGIALARVIGPRLKGNDAPRGRGED